MIRGYEGDLAKAADELDLKHAYCRAKPSPLIRELTGSHPCFRGSRSTFVIDQIGYVIGFGADRHIKPGIEKALDRRVFRSPCQWKKACSKLRKLVRGRRLGKAIKAAKKMVDCEALAEIVALRDQQVEGMRAGESHSILVPRERSGLALAVDSYRITTLVLPPNAPPMIAFDRCSGDLTIRAIALLTLCWIAVPVPVHAQGLLAPTTLGPSTATKTPGLNPPSVPGTAVQQIHLLQLPGMPTWKYLVGLTVEGLSSSHGGLGSTDILTGTYDSLTDSFVPDAGNRHPLQPINTAGQEFGFMILHPGIGTQTWAVWDLFLGTTASLRLARWDAPNSAWERLSVNTPSNYGGDPALALLDGETWVFYVVGNDIVGAPIALTSGGGQVDVSKQRVFILGTGGGKANSPTPIVDSAGQLLGFSHHNLVVNDNDHHFSFDLDPATPSLLWFDTTTWINNGAFIGGRFFDAHSSPSPYSIRHRDAYWFTGGRAAIQGLMEISAFLPPAGSGTTMSLMVVAPTFTSPISVPGMCGQFGVNPTGIVFTIGLHDPVTGRAGVSILIPNDLTLRGLKVPAQAVFLDPTHRFGCGFGASNTADLTIKGSSTPCKVTIADCKDVLCVSGTMTLKASGTPPGGTYSWAVTQPGGQVTPVAGAGPSFKMTGLAPSVAINDVIAEVTYTSPSGSCKAKCTFTAVKIVIERRSAPHPPQRMDVVNVGQFLELEAKVEPTTAPMGNFMWTVPGEEFKDYVESAYTTWATVAMKPTDYQGKKISYYWKPTSEQIHPKTKVEGREVRVTADSTGNVQCEARRTFQVDRNTNHIDLQAEDFYCEYNHPEAGNGDPQRRVLNEHINFHWDTPRNLPNRPSCGGGGPAAATWGGKFLQFHLDFKNRFNSWRKTFGYPKVVPWDPTTNFPIGKEIEHAKRFAAYDPTNAPVQIPSYLTLTGTTLDSLCFKKKHIKAFGNVGELGYDTEHPWHNNVHIHVGSGGNDMSGFQTAPKDPIFWRFHHFIDAEIHLKY